MTDFYQPYMDKWKCTRKEAKRTGTFYAYGNRSYMDTPPARDVELEPILRSLGLGKETPNDS